MRTDAELTGEIVGREGLATTVSAVAAQLSSLEKASSRDISALREVIRLELEKVFLEMKRVEHDSLIRDSNHAGTHKHEQTALETAKLVEEHWRSSANEWRSESKMRMETYPTKAEVDAAISRLESMIFRNGSDITSGDDKLGTRLTIVERFMLSAIAQMGTLRVLLAVAVGAIAIAGFFGFAR